MTGFFGLQKQSVPVIRRGASAIFLSTFYDTNGSVSQPSGASVNVSYMVGGVPTTSIVTMLPPGASGGDSNQWYAAWDSRGADLGTIYWSIHTVVAGLPITVDEGNFSLLGNRANLPTF